MGNFEAILMAIWCMVFLTVVIRIIPFLIFLPQIALVMSVIDSDLSLVQQIKLHWYLSGNLDVLSEAIDAFNNGETLKFAELFSDDDDDDDGEIACYENDFKKLKYS